LDTLTTALDALRASRIQARHRQHQQHRAEQGLRPHEPRSGRPPRLSFPDQVLATVLHMRLSLPEDTVGIVFGCSRSTIRRAITETRQLLAEHGTTIEPVTLPVPLPDLIAKIKSAC
ncbi:helix-turn-helix domain-containing protein, partial [Solihabitans fulvus]|uniref:helix-turn-helix domain-containing protein n=1 Tax=Solihabitans fulvus TaxID=1892852 RepID=UPI003F66E346